MLYTFCTILMLYICITYHLYIYAIYAIMNTVRKASKCCKAEITAKKRSVVNWVCRKSCNVKIRGNRQQGNTLAVCTPCKKKMSGNALLA